MNQPYPSTYPETKLENQSVNFQVWCNTRTVIREIDEIDNGLRVSYIDTESDHTKYLYIKNSEELNEHHI
jgi:hypothetical protein